MHGRILIAGIGNVFFGDDAFGVEVVRSLEDTGLPKNVDIRDFGIRGFDLACALLEDYHAVILIDAVCRGGKAGELYVIEPDVEFVGADYNDEVGLQPHGLDPAKVIRFARTMSDQLPKILLLGCEPETVDFDELGKMTLSEPVHRAVADAVAMVPTLLERMQTPNPIRVS